MSGIHLNEFEYDGLLMEVVITPEVPDGCVTIGSIYWNQDKSGLSEDMIDICLPGDYLISAGWCFSERGKEEEGNYVVTLSKGLDFVREPFETKDPYEVEQYIYSILW